MLMHLPKAVKTRWLRNPQTSAQLSGMDPGHHSGVRPGGVGRAQSVNASSIVIEITCNQVNFLRNHNGTKSKNELLAMHTRFCLGHVGVVDCLKLAGAAWNVAR